MPDYEGIEISETAQALLNEWLKDPKKIDFKHGGLITGIIGSFQVFTPAFILGGVSRFGPGSRHLRFYLLHVYVKAFQQGRLGYASALAWILFFISAVVVFIIYTRTERFVYYEEEGKGSS